MKTLIILLLSFFLTKTCQPKKENNLAQEQSKEQVSEVIQPEIAKIEEPTTPTSEKAQTGTTVAYEASTRGFFQKIIFNNSKITIHSDRNLQNKPEVIVLPDSDVLNITKLIQAIKLDNIANLKAPTEARTYDGAAHANITINYKGKEYVGNGFDAGKPPAELVKIVDKLLSYANKK